MYLEKVRNPIIGVFKNSVSLPYFSRNAKSFMM